ncbi:MAG: hypothetical protein EXS00_07360 [Phycisphaerales bacterium]|nr:hypothetical protein [Phycisphaerales bacterium]
MEGLESYAPKAFYAEGTHLRYDWFDMNFLEQLWAIARNTLLESIRQPIALVVVLAGVLLVIMSNPFSAYTMTDDNRMFVDIGLSTVFVAGAILSALLATNVLAREIENRTVLTVVSKPVARSTFLMGKYLGIAGTLTLCLLFLSLVFLLVDLHGVMDTAATPFHLPVILFGFLALLVALGVALWCNFFYHQSFTAVFITLGVVTLAIAYALALLFGPDFKSVAISASFEPELLKAVGLVIVAVLVMASISLAASTRLGQVVTLTGTLGLLILGLLSDWLFAREIVRLEKFMTVAGDAASAADHAWLFTCKAMYAIVPNFQMFWMIDAVNQRHTIPFDYLGYALIYAAAMTMAALAIGTALFQRREVG